MVSALWDVDAFTGTSAQALDLAAAYDRWALEPWHEPLWYWEVARRYKLKAMELQEREAAMAARYGR